MNSIPTFLFIIASLIIMPASAAEDSYELALKAFKQKEISTAEIHLKNALKSNPKNLPAKLLLAKVFIEKKSAHLAEQELNDALLKGADFNLVAEILAKSLLFQGKYDEVILLNEDNKLNQRSKVSYEMVKAEALQAKDESARAEAIYQATLSSIPNHLKANLGLANLYLDLNLLTKAEAIITNAEGFAKTEPEFWLVKGRWLLMAGDLTQALVLFEQANNAFPNNVKTLKYIVNVYIGLKEYLKAETLIEEVLVLAPNDPHTQFLKSAILRDLDEVALSEQVLMQLSTQLASIDSKFMDKQPQLQLIDAMTSYGQKNWEQARSKLNSYLVNEPNDINSAMLLADVYLKQNQGENALKLLSDYEEKLIPNKDYATILASLYIQFNQNFKAQPYLARLNQRYPNDIGILILTAKILSEQDKDLEALNLLKEAQLTKNSLYLQTLAALSLKLGKLDESQSYISLIIAADPENIKYKLLHAQLMLQQNNVEQATDIITDLYATNAANVEVQFNYALLQDVLRNKDVARKVLRQLVIDNKEHTQAWLKLAALEYQLGDVKAAISILEQQKKQAKVNTRATYQLAELYFSEADFESSLSLISNFLLNNRLDTYAIEIRAKNLIALNQTEAAKLPLSQLFGFWLNDANNLLRLSSLQLRIRDYAGAEKSLAVALELMPKSLPVFIETIKLHVRQSKFKEAENAIKLAEIAGFKDNTYLLILKGDVARGRVNLDLAYSLYASALDKDESNVVALIKLAQISHSDKLSKQFIPYLTVLVNKKPDAILERRILAEHLLTHEHWDASKFHYQLLLTQPLPADQRAIALNNLATIHIITKDYKLAVIQAKQAIEIINTIPAFFDTAGWALTLSGDVKGGLGYLRQAYSMSSSDTEVNYHLAYALAQLGRKAEAIEYLKFLVMAPDHLSGVALGKTLLFELTH
ncbi:tetratricopeptide repeat protein [Colwellia hornerae]|uniref:Tetratricopeptide repeat protein n=1 Tax=Colwellia hornerae TaxID=89402 RepID=A0A5C6QLH2_9GAMM|nr:tetratricopeptide repeat protein [Colwellia hornerae]TWX58619.1 tetratricopeptide repeat protein [Colwellia hornerae]TWX59685.1 tetratricopeptide repeat protein [Colwellia hornerae]TWX69412.1 tetratricopeptide repeat protein [Colwellia hornerae]